MKRSLKAEKGIIPKARLQKASEGGADQAGLADILDSCLYLQAFKHQKELHRRLGMQEKGQKSRGDST